MNWCRTGTPFKEHSAGDWREPSTETTTWGRQLLYRFCNSVGACAPASFAAKVPPDSGPPRLGTPRSTRETTAFDVLALRSKASCARIEGKWPNHLEPSIARQFCQPMPQ